MFLDDHLGSSTFISYWETLPINHLYMIGLNLPPSAHAHAKLQRLDARITGDRKPWVPLQNYLSNTLPQFQNDIRAGRARLDLGIISISPPDQRGMSSHGLTTGLHPAVLAHATKCFGVINHRMPRTQGPQVPITQFAKVFECDQPPLETPPVLAGPASKKIARYLASLIEDGDTIQCSDDDVAREFLRLLQGGKALGIHTDVISDEVGNLVARGVVTSGVRGSFARGTRALFDQIGDDPFQFYAVGDLACLRRTAALPRFVAVAPATVMDLSGQASLARRSGNLVWGGLGCFPEFLRGAALSPMGRSIVWLPSTHADGSSNIRFRIPETQTVSIPRNDIHFAVTEYGFANLLGKSLPQRAATMVEIAHPRYREPLMREAHEHGLLPRLWAIRNRAHYPIEHLRTVTTKSGQDIHIRPAKCSDFPELQRLFYQMSSQDIYFRFHAGVTSLSDQNAIHLCNTNYGPDYAVVATPNDWTQNEVLATGCYFIEPKGKRAELALMVHPSYQNQGIGKAMLGFLIDQARQAGLDTLTAEVIDGNHPSLHLLANAGLPITRTVSSGVHSIRLDLRMAREQPLVTRGLNWLKQRRKAS
ncbi:GNAT family N-acetyltransferase [Acanthopleuribacter pedis]|uniref:GNAT family N-acetyltransferase n=1 Tax=Acanthopleuribacter pedis TaxID=442870 RepID=A0A8J7U3F1_9BACT|nr:GNAT family N-acetyltransferase [Acanthopleuribacter pedis]